MFWKLITAKVSQRNFLWQAIFSACPYLIFPLSSPYYSLFHSYSHLILILFSSYPSLVRPCFSLVLTLISYYPHLILILSLPYSLILTLSSSILILSLPYSRLILFFPYSPLTFTLFVWISSEFKYSYYFFILDGPFNGVYQGADKEFLISNLKPGLTYKIRVASESKAGKGAWSPILSGTTLPVCPRDCTPPRCAKATPNSLYIEWGMFFLFFFSVNLLGLQSTLVILN